ncbi:hypothetical protein OEA41_000658 [Lepraria neglecta]|uniref:Uncharacterized protein n=1 Tax=Lepraria neglecta TaxID=209136 RepID=A0AAD9ZHL6_9LECA|nr:hypothetical protein OEA41_000658 [Lepraria neglecta]
MTSFTIQSQHNILWRKKRNRIYTEGDPDYRCTNQRLCFGIRADASAIGEKLSRAKAFLQEPDMLSPTSVYENSHYYDVPVQLFPASEQARSNEKGLILDVPMEPQFLRMSEQARSNDKDLNLNNAPVEQQLSV